MTVERQGDQVQIKLQADEAVTLADSLASAVLFRAGGTLDTLYGLLEAVLEPERREE